MESGGVAAAAATEEIEADRRYLVCKILTAGGSGFNVAKNESFRRTDGRVGGGEQIRLFVFRLTSITQTRLPPHHILIPAGAPLAPRLRLAHPQRAAALATHWSEVNAESGLRHRFISFRRQVLLQTEN